MHTGLVDPAQAYSLARVSSWGAFYSCVSTVTWACTFLRRILCMLCVLGQAQLPNISPSYAFREQGTLMACVLPWCLA